MKKLVFVAVILIVAFTGVAFYMGFFVREPAEAAGDTPRRRPGGGGGGFGSFGARPPMTVELDSATRADVTQELIVVGNLIGETTVEVVPKTAGRLEEMFVRLGDRVSRGQQIARIEDREIREQVKQAEAAFQVARATIRQREADLKFAETNVERSRNLFDRQLLPKQSLEDAEARYQANDAQLDLARAQFVQAQSRLEELRITLANTLIVSPVNGFVARRVVDPGAFVSPNQPIADVVDISRVRMVANVVEKDLRRVEVGESARVEVDAFPGETFKGRIGRVAPVLDPQTRTAQIEVEIPNVAFRLKPGMYARVTLTVEHHANALVVPNNALVDFEGKRGVFLTRNKQTATFQPVETGIEEPTRVEILSGLQDDDDIITTGASGLRDGDRILLPRRTDDPGGAGAPRDAHDGARPPPRPRPGSKEQR
ncbi:MAG TPA: efflux RND transporter periplasmic adaptor subunit [Vicinamibacterales bacterium]|jgi:RND family efflux transporter MFP subunit|nr:efflux RND transporter periplasmic adaptor subunit [Vicinamibacterales bacterium]